MSATLLLLALVVAYVATAAWPSISLDLEVKNALEDALPGLFRANLLPEPDATTATDELRRKLIQTIADLGVVDPGDAVTITRDARAVSIQAAIDTAVELKLVRKAFPVKLRPRVETSAVRETN